MGTFAKCIPMIYNKIIQKCIVELFIVLANHNFMVPQANMDKFNASHSIQCQKYIHKKHLV